ncbi:MAG: sulfatase family protein [Planctomycetota bacterium]|jgi:arylsulfatase A-like enzyme
MKRRDFLKRIGLNAASLVLAGCSNTSGQPLSKEPEQSKIKSEPKVHEKTAQPVEVEPLSQNTDSQNLEPAKEKPRQPNILFIMADDHATSAVSCYGGILSNVAKTPNIDRIAAEGARLDNCFVTNSICTPSRACILTGQYSHINGVYTSADKFNRNRQNVAQLLKQAGYQTAIVGQWHLTTEPAGFDYYCVLPGKGDQYHPFMKEKGKYWQDGIKGGSIKGGYATKPITEFSLNWLEKTDPQKPFFLMCHYNAPHSDWIPAKELRLLYDDIEMPEPDNLLDKYHNRSTAAKNATLKLENMLVKKHLAGHSKRELVGLYKSERRKYTYQHFIRAYLRCVTAIDVHVGKILDYLDQKQLTEDTIVIYTSSQGHFNGEHGYYDKRFMYEESIRMPFLIRYPREIKPGTVNQDITINADFAPTFLDYASQAAPDDMQGASFRANLRGQRPVDWRESMYYRYWMHLADHDVPAHYGIRTKRYKLIFYYGLPLNAKNAIDKPTQPEWELFDLEKDPQEMNNLYSDPVYTGVIKELKAELLGLKEKLGDNDEKYPQLMEVRQRYWD